MLAIFLALWHWCLSPRNVHGMAVRQPFEGDSGESSRSSSAYSMPLIGSQTHHHQSSPQSLYKEVSHWQPFGLGLAFVPPSFLTCLNCPLVRHRTGRIYKFTVTAFWHHPLSNKVKICVLQIRSVDENGFVCSYGHRSI